VIEVSDLVQYLYCPRKVYFLRAMGLRMVKPKMEYGREVHSRVGRVLGRLEGELFVNVYLESERYGLRGCVDGVLRRGEEYIPVDVKCTGLERVPYRWRMQMVAYAVLVEEGFGCRVRRGLIYLMESRRFVEVRVMPEDRAELRRLVERVERLLNEGSYPPAVRSNRCAYCEVERFCT